MRAYRALAVLGAVALVAVDASAASAQIARHFHDSWFWGAKGGGMLYQIQSDAPSQSLAPIFGADWVITRRKGGIYVAADYAILSGAVQVNDSTNPIDVTPGGRTTDIKDMFRVTFGGLLFPLDNQRFIPYFGFGIALSSLVKAEAQGTYASRSQESLVLSTIQNFKTTVSPNMIVGTQLRLPLASVFGQIIGTRSSNTFFLYTGPGWRVSAEAGVRYNIGSSIDRLR